MTWLAFGIFVGATFDIPTKVHQDLWYHRQDRYGERRRERLRYADLVLRLAAGFDRYWELSYSLSLFITYSAPAIGGLVVVGQMINSYGVCTRVA